MLQLPVPNSPQDMTPEWLTRALRSTGVIEDVSISSFELERVGEGSGFIGICVRITPRYTSQTSRSPSSVTAKFPSPDNSATADTNSTAPYDREIKFYAELAKKVRITTPKIYYSAFDEDSGSHVLIMEDMSHAQNGDDLVGRSNEDALFCVRQLARMHADWWGNTTISSFPGQHQTSDQRQRNFQRSWTRCAERIGGDLSPSFVTICDFLTDRIGEMSSALASRPQTLIHGDFRYDNMFFSRTDGETQLTLIDWQFVERACAAYDVSYFVASSLHTHQRREVEDELLATYHDTLIQRGIQNYALSEFLDDYRLSFIRFIESWVESGAYLEITNPRGHAYFLESLARLDTILEDHDIIGVIERRMRT